MRVDETIRHVIAYNVSVILDDEEWSEVRERVLKRSRSEPPPSSVKTSATMTIEQTDIVVTPLSPLVKTIQSRPQRPRAQKVEPLLVKPLNKAKGQARGVIIKPGTKLGGVEISVAASDVCWDWKKKGFCRGTRCQWKHPPEFKNFGK